MQGGKAGIKRAGIMQQVKSEIITYHLIDRIQTLARNFDFVRTGFETADRFMNDYALSIVEHRLFIKVLGIDPLQWDSLTGMVASGLEVMAALDLELESIPHIASRVNYNAGVRVGVRAHKVRPVVLEGTAAVDQQLDEESPNRTRLGYDRRVGDWRARERSLRLVDGWRGWRRRRSNG
jgi:hypothetical protein